MGQVSGCCFFSGMLFFLSSVGFFVLMILWIWRNKKKKGDYMDSILLFVLNVICILRISVQKRITLKARQRAEHFILVWWA